MPKKKVKGLMISAVITNGELAEMLGVNHTRISHMTREGVFKQSAKGQFDRKEATKAACQWLREKIAGGNTELGALKRMKLEQEIQISKNEIAIQEKSYMRIEDLKKPIEHRILLTRQKLLRLGNKIAPRVPYLKSENEIEKAINDEIEEALRELARPVDYEAEIAQEE